MADAKQNEWVNRVLGVTLADARASAGRPAPIPLRQESRQPTTKRYASIHCTQIWSDAEDTVVAQVESLADTLDDTDDATLRQIAAKSVREISTRLRGDLISALREVDAVPPGANADAIAKARQVIGQYRQQIGSDRLIGLLDNNPYGVTLTVRTTLTATLEQIDRELGA